MSATAASDHHARLAAFVGAWEGDETLHPALTGGAPLRATGRFASRLDLGGLFLITEYTESSGDRVLLRGHGVYGYDPALDRYTMHWFDSSAPLPTLCTGTWEGDTLTFAAERPRGRARYVYRHLAPGRYTFAIHASADGLAWTPLMEGEYRRC